MKKCKDCGGELGALTQSVDSAYCVSCMRKRVQGRAPVGLHEVQLTLARYQRELKREKDEADKHFNSLVNVVPYLVSQQMEDHHAVAEIVQTFKCTEDEAWIFFRAAMDMFPGFKAMIQHTEKPAFAPIEIQQVDIAGLVGNQLIWSNGKDPVYFESRINAARSYGQKIYLELFIDKDRFVIVGQGVDHVEGKSTVDICLNLATGHVVPNKMDKTTQALQTLRSGGRTIKEDLRTTEPDIELNPGPGIESIETLTLDDDGNIIDPPPTRCEYCDAVISKKSNKQRKYWWFICGSRIARQDGLTSLQSRNCMIRQIEQLKAQLRDPDGSEYDSIIE